MKVLLFGANGQVGRALTSATLPQGVELLQRGRTETDISNNVDVHRTLTSVSPDVVINAAAYTSVDQAEEDRERALLTNAVGARNIAVACQATGARLIHLSSDYVFDGTSSVPYLETDPVNPSNVYGKSKALGERLIRDNLDQHIILRTSWIFSLYRQNFVKSILELLGNRERIDVINDQTGCPTAAEDIATTLLSLVVQAQDELPWGTYHFCGLDPTTWYDFAVNIAELKRKYIPDETEITSTTSTEYGQVALRPMYSVLDCCHTIAKLGLNVPTWHSSLERLIDHWKLTAQ